MKKVDKIAGNILSAVEFDALQDIFRPEHLPLNRTAKVVIKDIQDKILEIEDEIDKRQDKLYYLDKIMSKLEKEDK